MKHLALLFTFVYFSFFIGQAFATDPTLEQAEAFADKQQNILHFTENKGQVKQTDGEAAPYVQFLLQRGNTNIYLLENGIAWQFNRTHYPEGYEELMANRDAKPEDREKLEKLEEDVRLETYRMDMHLIDANPNATITTEGRSEDFINYYNHDALEVHHYQKVTYHNIYPNIDWLIYTTDKGMKYDFALHPGANPNQIRMEFTNHEELYLDEEGNLIQGNSLGRFTEEAPISYQSGKEIATHFVLEGSTLRFAVDAYDSTQALTIDPARLWATYYGGTSNDNGYSCATDPSGNVYLAGFTYSNSAIASGGHDNSYGGNTDAFLVKFNTSGTRLWATYYGGTGYEYAFSCATDPSGNVYLAGRTTSTSSIASGGHDNSHGGNADAFLVKFNSSGTRQWATYYGGTSNDYSYSCATDPSGKVYLAGHTNSSSSIASGGHDNSHGGNTDAFLVKFNTNGTRQWATYYGGTNYDYSQSCATDPSGNVYLAGYTNSAGSIASGGHDNSLGASYDAFLVKFNTNGTRQWATYYGGTNYDRGQSCTTDPSGNVYLAGQTQSTSAIASGGHQNSIGGSADAFLVKFNSSGTRQWATYYGGTAYEYGQSCSTDPSGNVYLTGQTESTSVIASGGHQNSIGGSADAFLVKFNTNGTRQWATYYGGTSYDVGYSCTIDPSGNVYLAGYTTSTSAIASGGHDNTHGGSYDGYLVKFNSTDPTIATGSISGSPFCPGSTVTVPYVLTGLVSSNNVFIAELSDATGSFVSPVVIGTLTSTASGSISATIPNGTPPGTGYRIRVVSSAPSVNGTDNGTNLEVSGSYWYLDADNDGHYASITTACSSPGAGYTQSNILVFADCDDADPLVFENCGNLLPGSLLKDGDDEATLATWLGTSNCSYGELLYRKSLHGGTSSTYWSMVGGNGPAVVLIKTTNGRVFGAYRAIDYPVSPQNNYSTSPGTFLISFTDNVRTTTQVYPQYAVYDNINYGPTFGGGHDLNVNNTLSGGYTNLGHSYNCPVGTYGSSTCQSYLAGSYSNWVIADIEVYKIINVPACVTIGTVSPLSYCAGTAVTVPYTISSTFNAGNVFTAQLSDADGNFANPITIGTLSSTANGTISATIPSNTTAGIGYRIRVVSSNTANIGNANASAITITANAPWYLDADGDGYYLSSITACTSPGVGYNQTATTLGDCDDSDNTLWQNLTGYIDADGDGYTVGASASICSGATLPTGYSATSLGTDCDDSDNTIWQSASLYIDADGDSYDAGSSTICYGATVPVGYSTSTLGSDCDDSDGFMNPGAAEICGNAMDDDCDGLIDEDCSGNNWTGNVSTAWNNAGNWSSGSVPTGVTNAVIPTTPAGGVFPTVGITSAAVNDIELQSGATLTVTGSNALTVNGVLTNNGTVYVNNNGSLVQTTGSTLAGGGTYNVKRQGATGQRFNFWSSPITNQNGVPGTSFSFNPNGSTQDDTDDIPSDPGWNSYNGAMVPGAGYAGQGGGLATFSGTVNNGNVNLSLEYSTFDGSYTQTALGTPFNLVGNPYPSAISAADLINDNSDIDGTIYFWDDDLSGGTGYHRTDFAYWNGTGGLGTGSGSVGAPNGFISTAQGFYVRALNGSAVLNFNNAQREAGPNTQFFRMNGADSRLWFSVEKDSLFNQILIGLLEDATHDEDRLYDAVKMHTANEVSMAAMANDREHAIMAFPPPTVSTTVPLLVNITETGTYQFTANTMENFEGMDVYFDDVVTGNSYLLEEGTPISVAITQGEHAERFYLNFVASTVTGISENETPTLSAYASNGLLHIGCTECTPNATVELLDISGRLILKTGGPTFDNGHATLPLSGISKGVYLVRVTTENQVLSQKIFAQ